ncbi:MFS transporter [Microbulbifer sp. YPW1]|uniref:MFS transporter n=1 Tax=Microbulbifer sp. YPW1 TaxID=2745199 RepID=UPI001597ABE1|nr:MFS transporter [Microbulbifer sp. YPW1]QKX17200.1 MFS transporter [Microbulbifer sp. YPW1]
MSPIPTASGRFWLYALPQFAIAYVTLAIVNFVPAFYASEVGLPMLTVSAMMLASRGLDVVTDPLIGNLSDRTRSTHGRRKPWLVAGLPILIAGAWILFLPPEGASALYYFSAISVLFLGLTMMQLPYIAWGAELYQDYDIRTRITGIRERVGALGSAGALVTALVLGAFGIVSLGSTLEAMAWVLTLGAPLLVAIALHKVPAEPASVIQSDNGEQLSFWQGIRVALGNPVFRLFAGGVFLIYLGLAPAGATGWFLFDHLLQRSEWYAPSILLDFTFSFLGLPFWIWLSVRTSKHRALALALAWSAGVSLFIPFIVEHGVWATMAASAVRSFALGGILMLPFAIVADVIDMDRLKTGQQRTGIYMAFGGITIKLAITVGVSLALAIPGLFGFDATNRENSADALFSVKATYAWLGALFFALAVPLFWRFPLTRQQVQAMQNMIAERQGSVEQERDTDRNAAIDDFSGAAETR